MKTRSLVLACGAAAAMVSTAAAQTNGLQNGGFESICFICGGPFAEGWHSPGGDTIAPRRFVGDTGTPAIQPVGTPNAITPRTGTSLQEVGTHGTGGFEGVTTDTINYCHCDQTCQTFCSAPFPYFDPIFDYNGGDIIASGYYMIPASDPLVGDLAGMSLSVRVLNQNVASVESLSISGHTDGQWVQFSLAFSRADIQQQYECNLGVQPDCGCNCVPASPLPDRVKIVLVRFAADGTPTSGTIYWDDISFTQLPGGPTCDSIDFNGDGLFPDTLDIDDFLSVFSGGPCSNDPNCGDIDYNNDGLFPDTLDIDALLSVFSGGSCLV
ncbi:MAG TPA: hypothetical protein VHN77_08350 [Phycisphaerales bacterium]|nr:hypothetical protein [Phycisphaerales bacterium]